MSQTDLDFVFYMLEKCLQSEFINNTHFKEYLTQKNLQSIANDKFQNKYQQLKETIDKELNEFIKTKQIPQKKLRGIVDGVFDMTHFGHFNVFRQASKICDEVIVCLNSDKSVLKHKGPTIYSEQQRKTIVEGCKWVKEVHIEDDYILKANVLKKYNADFVIHGDDIIIDENGESIYSVFERQNAFREIKRTTGISTTDVVYKILNLEDKEFYKKNILQQKNQFKHRISKIKQFSPYIKPPKGKIVFVAGSFDMLNPGHVKFLQKAASMGDYLLVGVYSDSNIQKFIKNKNYPIMNIYDRILALLAIKYVDDILIDTPIQINDQFIAENNIDYIVDGKIPHLIKGSIYDNVTDKSILKVIDSGSDYDNNDTYKKIQTHKDIYEKSVNKKLEKLKNYYNTKQN